MRIKKWLTINNRGSARLTQHKPRIAANEVSVLLELHLPDALFKQPILEAKITIPESAVRKSPLSAEVAENVQTALQQATGLDFSIRVVEDKEEQG